MCFNYTMEDNVIVEIRRENLNAYCVKRGWVSQKDHSKGSPSELSRRLGRGVAFWSNVLRDPKESFGPLLAREIEEKLDLPKYSLDGDEEHSDFQSVDMLNVEVSAGGEGHLTEVVEVKGSLHFRRDYLREEGINPKNAAIVKVKGESMEPTIYGGALILINQADTSPKNGNVYAFVYDSSLLVKRFFIGRDRTWIARSDNMDKDKFKDIVLDGPVPFRILGRAVWVGMKM